MPEIKILYAEDDVANQRLLQIKLKQLENVSCDVADNGLDALTMFKKGSYDLVILDQYMPEMDGIDVAKSIRVLSSDIPIIAITSDDDKTLKQRLLSSGFNEVIFKPLHGKNALDIISSFL